MKKMNIPTVAELETLSTHELAELLANVVLLLRRFPDVPISDVISNGSSTSNGHGLIKDPGALAAKVRKEPKRPGQAIAPDWLSEE